MQDAWLHKLEPKIKPGIESSMYKTFEELWNSSDEQRSQEAGSDDHCSLSDISSSSKSSSIAIKYRRAKHPEEKEMIEGNRGRDESLKEWSRRQSLYRKLKVTNDKEYAIEKESFNSGNLGRSALSDLFLKTFTDDDNEWNRLANKRRIYRLNHSKL